MLAVRLAGKYGGFAALLRAGRLKRRRTMVAQKLQ
jgi:hypothetical protein